MVFFWFLVGALVGAAITWFFLNQRYTSELADRDRQISELQGKFSKTKTAPALSSDPEPQPASAIVQAAPTKSDDDLTRIKGVGAVLKGKLNDLGIHSFEQIAALTQSDIDRVNAQLSFKGRIEREKWVEQAKALIKSD